MLVDFTGKIAVVTGAAGGIGYVCAKTLLESGAKVALVDVNQAVLDKAAGELSSLGTVQGFAVDLSNVDAIAPAVTRVRQALGEIDVLVQCAGLMGGKPGLEVTQADWDKTQNVNARGLFFMMQQVAPGRHQMAHYAFASGIMNLSVMLTGAVSGYLSDWKGYGVFFIVVMLATIPAFVMTWFVPFTYDDKPTTK